MGTQRTCFKRLPVTTITLQSSIAEATFFCSPLRNFSGQPRGSMYTLSLCLYSQSGPVVEASAALAVFFASHDTENRSTHEKIGTKPEIQAVSPPSFRVTNWRITPSTSHACEFDIQEGTHIPLKSRKARRPPNRVCHAFFPPPWSPFPQYRLAPHLGGQTYSIYIHTYYCGQRMFDFKSIPQFCLRNSAHDSKSIPQSCQRKLGTHLHGLTTRCPPFRPSADTTSAWVPQLVAHNTDGGRGELHRAYFCADLVPLEDVTSAHDEVGAGPGRLLDSVVRETAVNLDVKVGIPSP